MKSIILTCYVLIVVSCVKEGKASLIRRPVNSETPSGELAYFNCSTTKTSEEIQWFHYPKVNSERKLVYGFNQFHIGYTGFLMDRVNSTGSYNLVIPSVKIENAGKYECQDDIGRGEKDHAELIVLDSPEFESRVETKNVIGINNCGIEPSQLILSCSVGYHGSMPPTFEWRKVGDDMPIIDGVAHGTPSNNHIIYNLTLKGKEIENGSSYACFAKQSKSPKASCKSDNITVVGNVLDVDACKFECCQRYIDAIICIFLIVVPFFNAVTAYVLWRLHVYIRRKNEMIYCPNQEENIKGSRFPCKFSKNAVIFVLLMAIPLCIGLLLWYLLVYRREKLANDQRNADESDSPLNLQTAESSPGENEGHSQAIEFKQNELNRKQNDTIAILRKETVQKQNKIEEIEKRNLELMKEIEGLKKDLGHRDETVKQLEAKVKELEHHLYPPEIVEYVEKPDVVLTIKTNAATNERKSIVGLAVLENELFVLHNKSSKIDVYDSTTYQFERMLQFPGIEEPFDLATGKTDKCLFIIGLANATEDTVNKDYPESVIVRVDAKGELIVPWPKPSGGPKGRLSTSESNLIVCLLEKNIINEFSRDGELIRTVRLSPSVDFKNPLHAIKVTSMHYAVSHGFQKGQLHRICVVDSNGNIVKERKQWKETLFTREFNAPFHFIEDEERSILVTDTGHNRILLFNSALNYQRKLIELDDKQFPMRICFDGSQRRLFVATNKTSTSKGYKDGLVLIYNIK